MPWIIADEEGRICHARKKVYNTERGAKMGYKATLDNYLQMWYLYDEEDLDYGFYQRKMLKDDWMNGLLTADVDMSDEAEARWNELIEQFKSIYSIQEVTMSLGKK